MPVTIHHHGYNMEKKLLFFFLITLSFNGIGDSYVLTPDHKYELSQTNREEKIKKEPEQKTELEPIKNDKFLVEPATPPNFDNLDLGRLNEWASGIKNKIK